MKKLGFVAMVLALGAGVAFASSLGIPWFVDNAAVATGWPPATGNTTIVFLHNNLDEQVECQIQYYNQEGTSLGPATDNTFYIPANSTMMFRPVADDPVPNGQESVSGALVPNRPRVTDTKKNGSAVIRWFGDSTDVQGMVAVGGPGAFSYAHLLPPGL